MREKTVWEVGVASGRETKSRGGVGKERRKIDGCIWLLIYYVLVRRADGPLTIAIDTRNFTNWLVDFCSCLISSTISYSSHRRSRSRTNTYARTYTLTTPHTHIHTHTHTHTYIHTHIHTHKHFHLYKHTHMRSYTYTHTHLTTYINLQTHTQLAKTLIHIH